MGLFDGRIADGHGSTAQVAGLLGAPVVLVVDARGQCRSLAALLHGFRSFDPAPRRVDLAGVVLNRVGSRRHEEVLRAAAEEVGLPVLGALPRRDALAVPSRHLGLVTAAEHGGGRGGGGRRDGRAGRRARRPRGGRGAGPPAPARSGLVGRRRPRRPRHPAGGRCPTRTQPLPRSGPSRVGPDRASPSPPPGSTRPGLPGAGRNIRRSGLHVRLRRARRAAVGGRGRGRRRRPAARRGPAGRARPRSCSPAASPKSTSARSRPTPGCAPRYGALAVSGAPLHAECGGLLYLCATLDDAPMCDVLPAQAAMTPRLTLGYRDAVALTPSPLHPAGARVTGHEFHRCAVTPRAPPHRRGPGAAPSPRASSTVASTRRSCTPTRRGIPEPRSRGFVAAAARGT